MKNDKPESKTLAKVIQEAIDSKLYDTHTALPCKIIDYDTLTQNASVQPLLKRKYRTDKTVNLPQIQDVPVQWPSGNDGKSYIHIPLIPGDLGMVVFSERSLDLWLAGDGNSVSPLDPRRHHISDAIFIPGIRPFKAAISDTSSQNMVIQHDEMRLELDPTGKISIAGAEELLTIVNDIIEALENAFVVTAIGAQPFTTATLSNFSSIKTRLEKIKRI